MVHLYTVVPKGACFRSCGIHKYWTQWMGYSTVIILQIQWILFVEIYVSNVSFHETYNVFRSSFQKCILVTDTYTCVILLGYILP